MATKTAAAKKAPVLTTEQKKKSSLEIQAAPYLSAREKKDFLGWLKEGRVVRVPKLSNYAIKPYDCPGQSVHPDGAVYDIREHTFLPFAAYDHELHTVLDAIAFATEEGKMNSRAWVKKVFGTEEAYTWFMDELEAYDQCFRIHDRWWAALARLAEHESHEEGFIHSADIAEKMREHVEETGQAF